MKKVLFITVTLEIGGVEQYILRFITKYNIFIDKTILCKRGTAGVLEEKYKKQGANIKLLKLGWFSIIDYYKLYRYLKKEKFDVVCDFTGDFSGLVLFTAKLAGIKKRLAFYRESKYQFKSKWHKDLYGKAMNYLVLKNASKILSNSNAALNNFFPNWQKENSFYQVIYNGIPNFDKITNATRNKFRAQYNIGINDFLIGHVGRYSKQKNQLQVLKIAEKLIKRNDNIYFFLCGRGIIKHLSPLVINLGLEKRIILDESRNDIDIVLQSLDAFSFPSIDEGNPNALLEAMSCGIPFVASNIEPIVETIPSELEEYLTNPNDLELAISLFEKIIDKKHNNDFNDLEKWTKSKYNLERNFNLFYKNIIEENFNER